MQPNATPRRRPRFAQIRDVGISNCSGESGGGCAPEKQIAYIEVIYFSVIGSVILQNDKMLRSSILSQYMM